MLGCSLAMTLSVWGRKTHEVLMLTYLILIVWLCSPIWVAIVAFSLRSAPPPIATPFLWECAIFSNPYYLAYAPYMDPGKVGWLAYLGFLGGCLIVSGLLAGLATVRIRGVAMKPGRPVGGKSRRSRFALRFPRLPRLPGFPARRWTATRSCGGSGTGRSRRGSCAWPGCCTRASVCSGSCCRCNSWPGRNWTRGASRR